MTSRASRSFPWAFAIPAGKWRRHAAAPRCAELWLNLLLARLPQIELTLLIGQYAQRHFLAGRRKSSLAETAKAWREYAPEFIPLPHPSPRNQPWFKHHAWFEEQLVPMLQMRIRTLLTR